jgi:hypothetical protein
MRRLFVAPVFALALALLAASAVGRADDKESFVKRTVTRLEKNNNNAGQEDQVKVKGGDVIELEWSYPVVPGAIPRDASARSDSEAVRFVEITRVVGPKLVGAGKLAAVFKAEKEGKATLTFTVESKAKGGDDTGAVLKCAVEVFK